MIIKLINRIPRSRYLLTEAIFIIIVIVLRFCQKVFKNSIFYIPEKTIYSKFYFLCKWKNIRLKIFFFLCQFIAKGQGNK